MAPTGLQNRNKKGTPRSANSRQPPCASIDNQGGGSWHLLGAKIVAKRHPLEHRFPPSPRRLDWQPGWQQLARVRRQSWYRKRTLGAPRMLRSTPRTLHARSAAHNVHCTILFVCFFAHSFGRSLAFYRPFLAGTGGPVQEREWFLSIPVPIQIPFQIRSCSRWTHLCPPG